MGEKRKWQSRLGAENIPKFIATLVYVGGGRPKADKVKEEISSINNLVPWLKKRDLDVGTFEKLVAGKLPPKKERKCDERYGGPFQAAAGAREQSPYHNSAAMLAARQQQQHQQQQQQQQQQQLHYSNHTGQANEFRAGILNRAMTLTKRCMMLRTPEDPDVQHLIQDESEAQIAVFLSKTFTNAIMMYNRQGAVVGHIGPTSKPGPIGPPGSMGHIRGEFSNDSSMFRGASHPTARNEGLYGLSKPLLDYNTNGSLEPPYKRKYEDW